MKSPEEHFARGLLLGRSCSGGAGADCGLLLMSLRAAGSPRVLRAGSQGRDLLQGTGLGHRPAQCPYSARQQDRKERGEGITKLSQTEQKCFQLLSGAERLEMTSSQHSLILFCYDHYTEPPNPLHPLTGRSSLSILTLCLWATLSHLPFSNYYYYYYPHCF